MQLIKFATPIYGYINAFYLWYMKCEYNRYRGIEHIIYWNNSAYIQAFYIYSQRQIDINSYTMVTILQYIWSPSNTANRVKRNTSYMHTQLASQILYSHGRKPILPISIIPCIHVSKILHFSIEHSIEMNRKRRMYKLGGYMHLATICLT